MKITVFAEKACGRIDRYWTKCVGSCHAATALREDWRRQLRQCREEFGFEYVRFHGLLDDDMSVCLKNEKGELEYSFFNVDSIFDFLLEIGMKPFIELSFMPEVLASGRVTVFHYRGNITPPEDYADWADLDRGACPALGRPVRRGGSPPMVLRGLERAEPVDFFWSGTMEDYFKLYEYAARAVKKVDSRLKVGGPSTAIDAWIPEFKAYCEKNSVPLDFISTHHYPTDAAFGLGLDMEEQMARQVRGNLRARAKKARGESGSLPFYYTEWNCSPSPHDPYHDKPYNAAFIVKTVADNHGPRGLLFVLDILRYLRGGRLYVQAVPRRLRPAEHPRDTEALLSRVSDAVGLNGDRLEIDVVEASPTVECVASREGGRRNDPALQPSGADSPDPGGEGQPFDRRGHGHTAGDAHEHRRGARQPAEGLGGDGKPGLPRPLPHREIDGGI